MDSTFIDILKKLVAEQGREALLDAAKCKAFIDGYAAGEYKKEYRFIVQAVEAGAAKAIDAAGDLASCKQAQVRELVDEFGLDREAAQDMVDTLAQVLRGDTTGMQAAPAPMESPQTPTPQSIPNGLQFSIGGKSVTITRYIGRVAVLDIPEWILGLPVIAIGNEAFDGCISLIGITIPSSVAFLGINTFSRCSSLTSIEIPFLVTSISNGAFRDCSSLTSITIPSSVISIGNHAFIGCSSLTNIIIPPSVTSIGNWAFIGCRKLISIDIPSSVKAIGERAFNDCSSLTSIIIPSSVTSIGSYAFTNCKKLTSVTLSRRTRFGQKAFPHSARIIYSD